MPRFEPHPARRPAIVTGASSGIGQAAAIALAEAGHPVVLGARRVEVCEVTAEQIRAAGGEAAAVALDLTDAASIRAFTAAAEAQFGPIEVLVSNAGEVLPTLAHETDPDAFEAQLHVNLLGAQRLVGLVVPGMVDRRRGDVVFVTSDVVREPRPRMASYVTAKWGLEGLARAMQLELEGTGVRASIIRPGPTTTGQGSTWDPREINAVLEQWAHHGLMRHDGYLRPQQVADTIVTMVTTPRGTHLTMIEIQPEAPATPIDDASAVRGAATEGHLTLLEGGLADDAQEAEA
jgi:NADP-dependent 3-hydroxy acid dehydrogenase YdfG